MLQVIKLIGMMPWFVQSWWPAESRSSWTPAKKERKSRRRTHCHWPGL